MGRFSPDIFWGFVEVVVRPRLSELRRTRSPRCARARAASFPDPAAARRRGGCPHSSSIKSSGAAIKSAINKEATSA